MCDLQFPFGARGSIIFFCVCVQPEEEGEEEAGDPSAASDVQEFRRGRPAGSARRDLPQRALEPAVAPLPGLQGRPLRHVRWGGGE